MANWFTAYAFRVRMEPSKAPDGSNQFVIPAEIVKHVGATVNDAFMCVVQPDGSVLLRKMSSSGA